MFQKKSADDQAHLFTVLYKKYEFRNSQPFLPFIFALKKSELPSLSSLKSPDYFGN